MLRAEGVEGLEHHQIEGAIGDFRSVGHQQECRTGSVESQQGRVFGFGECYSTQRRRERRGKRREHIEDRSDGIERMRSRSFATVSFSMVFSALISAFSAPLR